MMQVLNILDFGADPSGETDSTKAIKAALETGMQDNSGKTTKKGAHKQIVFFPTGTYKMEDESLLPITLGWGISLIGEGNIGTRNTKLQGKGGKSTPAGTKYLFQFSEKSGFPRVSIENIAFIGANILDLRVGYNVKFRRQPGLAIISNCSFANVYNNHPVRHAKGIAINILNHDFSIISACNFIGFSGLCAIRVLGWLQTNGAYGHNKATTQVKVNDCTFNSGARNNFSKADWDFEKDTIGISCDLVDSIKIYGNDFTTMHCGIDIGGAEFSKAIQRLFPPKEQVGHFYRDQPDIDKVKWGPPGKQKTYDLTKFHGTGWFSNVNIRDNHFESFTIGISCNGSRFEHNHGTRIESNNFQNPWDDSVMIDLVRTNTLSTFNNELYFSQPPPAGKFKIGIRYHKTASCRFILDSFYGNNNATQSPNADGYKDAGGNYGCFFWSGNKGQAYRDPSGTAFNGNLHIESGAFTGKVPAVGDREELGEQTHHLFRQISKHAYKLPKDATIELLTLSTATPAGFLTLTVKTPEGTTSATFAIGHDSVTPLTGAPSGYALSIAGGHLIYQNKPSALVADTFISGVLMGTL